MPKDGEKLRNRSLGLRRSVQGEKSKSAGKKGWNGSFKDELRPPKAEATPILLTRGEYADEHPQAIKDNNGEPPLKHYYTYPAHSYKFKIGNDDAFRQGRCAAGWNDKDGECLGCQVKTNGDKRVGHKRDRYSMNLIHLALHHKTELKDHEGKPRRFEQDDPEGRFKRGDPIVGWQEVTRARDRKDVLQDLDKLLKEQNAAMFRKKYIDVGSGHLDDLMQIADLARKHCRCGGMLAPTAFFCQGCEEKLVDVEEENMDAAECNTYSLQRQRCKNCGVLDFPQVESLCDECTEPTPLEFWEVVAYIKKTGEGTNSHISVEKIVPIYEFLLPNEESLLKWDASADDFEIDAEGEFVLRDDVATLASNQFNFNKVQQPYDNDYIAKFLNTTNVFKAGGAKEYGRSRRREAEGETGNDEDKAKTKVADSSQKRRPVRR